MTKAKGVDAPFSKYYPLYIYWSKNAFNQSPH